MNYYLVLGAINSMIDYTELYNDEGAAVQSALQFVGSPGPLSARSVITNNIDGDNRRVLYLPLEINGDKIGTSVSIVVYSVPYLHRKTRAEVFYDEQAATEAVRNFNAVVSRTTFHAYKFSFLADLSLKTSR